MTALAWAGVSWSVIPCAMEPSPSTLINSPSTNGELSDPRYLLLRSKTFWITMAPGADTSIALSIWANSAIRAENSLANIAACSSGSAWDKSSADASRTARRVLPSSSMEIPRSDPLTPCSWFRQGLGTPMQRCAARYVVSFPAP